MSLQDIEETIDHVLTMRTEIESLHQQLQAEKDKVKVLTDALEKTQRVVEQYERIETPFDKLLSGWPRQFLFDNELELKYLPIYADQPDPTYVVKWVWEVRDKHGASVCEAHEWMYSALESARRALAAVKEK